MLPSFFIDYEAEKSYENEDPQNGLFLNDVYLPEEMILKILSYIEPNEILEYSPVCRKWNKLIKSFPFWSAAYKKTYNRRAKKLLWYIFYCLFSTDLFDNKVVNGNGEDGLKCWDQNYYDNTSSSSTFRVICGEPISALSNMPELMSINSYFEVRGACCASNCGSSINESELQYHVFDYYKPHIYLSEWTIGQEDCGSFFKLTRVFIKRLRDLDNLPCAINVSQKSSPKEWKKIELLVTEYPDDIEDIILEHQGHDLLPYGVGGCNITGAVMKCVFDSIESLLVDENGQMIPKTYSEFKFTTNSLRQEDCPEFRTCWANFSYQPYVVYFSEEETFSKKFGTSETSDVEEY